VTPVDDDILAKDGGGGDPLGSIDDSVVQLTVAGNGNNSATWRVSTSTHIVATRHSLIRIGPGRRRKPWGGSVSLARALVELTVEGDVAIGTCISGRITARGLSTGGAGRTIDATHNHDGRGALAAGSSIGLTTSDICGDVGCCGTGSGALVLDPIRTEKPTSNSKEPFRRGNLDQQTVTYNIYQAGPAFASPRQITTPATGSDRHLLGELSIYGAFLDVRVPSIDAGLGPRDLSGDPAVDNKPWYFSLLHSVSVSRV
jgi:hypothetical protein